MAAVKGGPLTWSASRDDDGFRTYKVTWLVKALITESPVAVMFATGLPQVGTVFNVNGYTGVDNAVWCRPEMTVSIAQELEGDPAKYYLVENTYSNKWEDGKSYRCQNATIEHPLLEPMKVSGGFNKAQWQAKTDRFGNKLLTSANEPILGPETVFDYVRPTIHIEQNVGDLGLSTFAGMVNTVNESPMWGLPERCIKLTNAPWERKVCGKCDFFYTRSFDFEIDYYNADEDGNPIGFDREVYDIGSLCVRGQWQTMRYLSGDDTTPNPDYGKYKVLSNEVPTGVNQDTICQSMFAAYKDMNDENTRVLLDGSGYPANAPLMGEASGTAGPPAARVLEYYKESNFLLLGIPTSF